MIAMVAFTSHYIPSYGHNICLVYVEYQCAAQVRDQICGCGIRMCALRVLCAHFLRCPQPRLSWLAAVWTLFVRGLTVNCMIIWSYFFATAITAGSAYAALRCVAALPMPPLQT